MPLHKYFLWYQKASTDQEVDQLLGRDFITVTAKPKVVVIGTLFRAYGLLLHVIILGLFIRQSGFVVQMSNSHLVKQTSWSPVLGFVEYEARDVTIPTYKSHNVLGGPPTEEQDNAWDHLINGSFFNASLQELARAGERLENLAELTDGGFLASIGVYHELHCLRQMRFYVYKDLYYPGLNQTEDSDLQDHLDHCLETLRQTVMCYGNTAITSFFWPTPRSKLPLPRTSARSVCARWDTIESWAYSRKVSVDPDYK